MLRSKRASVKSNNPTHSKKSVTGVNDRLHNALGGGTTSAILSFLPAKEIAATLSTCRILKQFGDSNQAWNSVLEAHFGPTYLTKKDSKLQYRAKFLLEKALDANFVNQSILYPKLKEFLDQCHSHIQPNAVVVEPSIPWTFYFYAHYYFYANANLGTFYGLRALEGGDLRIEKTLYHYFLHCPSSEFSYPDLEQFSNLLERENSTLNSTHAKTVMMCVRAGHPNFPGDVAALKRKALENFFESLYPMDNPIAIVEFLTEIIFALRLEPYLFEIEKMMKEEFEEEIPSDTLDILMRENIYNLIIKDNVFHTLLIEHLQKLISNKVGIAAFYYAKNIILNNLENGDQDPPNLARRADLLFEAKPYLLLAIQYGEFQALLLLYLAHYTFPDLISYEKLVEMGYEALNNFPDNANIQAFIEILKEPAKEGDLLALYYLFVKNEIPWQSSGSLTWILLSNILNENLLDKTIEQEFENELLKIEKGSMWVRCALTILYALRGEAEKAKDQYQFSALHMPEFLSVGREEECCTQEIEEAVMELEHQQKAMETPLRRSLRKR